MNDIINPSDFYTPIDEIKEELYRRRSDKKLLKKVEDFLGEEILKIFDKAPRAVLSQYIVVPANDTFHFIELAKKINIEPIFLEYADDKLVAKNIGKYLLGKIYFCDKKNLEDFKNIPKLMAINFNVSEGKILKNINTLWGEKLVDFHHNIINIALPISNGRIFDFSVWFKEKRYLTEYYYLYFLAIFICHGVFFENIELDGREEDFSKNKIIPSFYKLQEMFGVKPLIYPLIPLESYHDLYWWCYPEKNIEIIKKYLNNKYRYTFKI